MIFFVLLFFVLLALFIIRKNNGFDLSSFIAIIFGISILFSVFIDVLGIRSYDTRFYSISIGATFAYCALFMMCFLPIMFYFDGSRLVVEPVKNDKPLKILSIVSFGYFVLNFVMSYESIFNVLNGDMAEIRRLIRLGEGEGVWFASLPFVIRIPFVFISMLMCNSWIYLFLAAFCLSVQKMEKKFALYFFIASLYAPIMGILGADRSKMTYWIISAAVVYVYFLPLWSSVQKKYVSIVGSIVCGLIITYIVAMTNSRFGQMYFGSVGGAQGGVISYLGQSFINFTCFFDELELPETKISIVLPFLSKIFSANSMNGVQAQHYLSNLVGRELWVFYPFFGYIMALAGKQAMFFFCVCYTIVAMFFMQKTPIKNLFHCFCVMACSSVFFLGLFAHYYSASERTFSVFFFGVIFYLMTRKKYE